MKRAGIGFLLIGFLVVSYAMYELVQGSAEVDKELIAAKQMIEENKELTAGKQKSVEGSAKGEEETDLLPDFQLEVGDNAGVIEIDSVKIEAPIISGTDEGSLRKGVGHMPSTKLPGQNDQILLAGHRDTVFEPLEGIKEDDLIKITMPYGTYEYRVIGTDVVKGSDTSIIQSSDKEELVLVTCYPFQLFGAASDRFIVYAVPLVSR